MHAPPATKSVLVTGATGFVGRSVVRELLFRGYRPVCLVSSAERLRAQHRDVPAERLAAVVGRLSDEGALRNAAAECQTVIHLVGIIIERRLRGQTFQRVHVDGTRRVIAAAQGAGIDRYLHMSALGTRPNAVARYHQTKWEAEELVRASGLKWTIFRPSLIHGPDGEFMRLMKAFVCGLNPPVIPYFGAGTGQLQPVHVKDVARCFVDGIPRDDLTGQVVPLAGPRVYTWIELYNACRALMPGARRWKPLVSQPVPVAKMLARTVMSAPMAFAELVVPSLGMMRFDVGQVQMSQEDNVGDHTIAERLFHMRMRNFEEELAAYADAIG